MKTILITIAIVFSGMLMQAQEKSTELFKNSKMTLMQYTDIQTGKSQYMLFGKEMKYSTIVGLITVTSGSKEKVVNTIQEILDLAKHGKDVSGNVRDLRINMWSNTKIYIANEDEVGYTLLTIKDLNKIKTILVEL